MNAIPELIRESWTEPTVVLPLAERPIHRPRTEEIFYSVLPPAADLVSIHRHLLEEGRFLVFEWVLIDGRYEQAAPPINVPSLKNAREYVPPGSSLEPAPEDWAVEAWRVR